MDVSEFSFRIILIFIPGLIAAIIVGRMTESSETNLLRISIRSLLFGFISYYFYYSLYQIKKLPLPFLNIVTLKYSTIGVITYLFVLMSLIYLMKKKRNNEKLYRWISFISILTFLYFIYVCTSFIRYLNLPLTFPEYLTNVSAKIEFSEILAVSFLAIFVGIVFSYFINLRIFFRVARFLGITKRTGSSDVWTYIMNSEIPPWVRVRDQKNNLLYEGWIQSFSDENAEKELLLREVIVYDNSRANYLYEIPALYLVIKTDTMTIEFPVIA